MLARTETRPIPTPFTYSDSSKNITRMTTDKQLLSQSGCLVALHKDVQPASYTLQADICTIGRSPVCQVVVGRNVVSRLRARIERDRLHYVLHDAGSANGTFRNGHRIQGAHLLANNDQIGLGGRRGCCALSTPTFVPANRLRYDERAMTFALGGQALDLTPAQFKLLSYLYQHAGDVCTRESCAAALWGRDYDPGLDADALDRAVSSLLLLCQFRSGWYSSIRLVRMSSVMASSNNASHTCRWMAANERRRRSGRGGKGPTRAPPCRRLLLPRLPLLPHQKAVAQHDQRRVAMEAMPQAALVLIPPQLIFGILVKALDVVPAMRIFHQHLQWRGSGKIAPVVGRIAWGSRQRAFTDQPSPLPLALPVLAPRAQRMKFGCQPAAAPFAPADCAPAATRPCGHDRIHALQSLLRCSGNRHAEVGSDGDDILLVAGFQAIEKVGVVTIVRISGDAGMGYSPRLRLIQQCQSNLRLGLELKVIGDMGLGPPHGIGTPVLRQIQPDRHGPGDRSFGILAGHRDLAVGDFANRAGILAADPDRGVALFEKARVIENQNRIALGWQGQHAFHALSIERSGIPLHGRE